MLSHSPAADHAGFAVTTFDEPESRDDVDDADLAAIAEFQSIQVATVHMFIERTSNLPHVAAFRAVRPG